VKYHTYLALDTIPGFTEAGETNNIKEMARLYRKHVIGYKARNREKFNDGQQGFFYEVGGLAGLLNYPHPEHGWKKPIWLPLNFSLSFA